MTSKWVWIFKKSFFFSGRYLIVLKVENYKFFITELCVLHNFIKGNEIREESGFFVSCLTNFFP